MTLLYRRCLHFLYTIQNNHSLFYFSVSQKHPRFRLAILIYNLEMWRSYCNMKTAAWNYDDLWLGSAFSNGVFNTVSGLTKRPRQWSGADDVSEGPKRHQTWPGNIPRWCKKPLLIGNLPEDSHGFPWIAGGEHLTQLFSNPGSASLFAWRKRSLQRCA